MLTKGALYCKGVENCFTWNIPCKTGPRPQPAGPGAVFWGPGWVGTHLRARAHETVDRPPGPRATAQGSRTTAHGPNLARHAPGSAHQGARIAHQATRSWVFVTRITNTGDQATQTQTRPASAHQVTRPGGQLHQVQGARTRHQAARPGGHQGAGRGSRITATRRRRYGTGTTAHASIGRGRGPGSAGGQAGGFPRHKHAGPMGGRCDTRRKKARHQGGLGSGKTRRIRQAGQQLRPARPACGRPCPARRPCRR